MQPIVRNMLINALLLGLFAVAGTGLVALTWEGTAERIAENERQALLDLLHQLIPPDRHDNDLALDWIQVTDPDLLGTRNPVTVYRARRNGQPEALVMTPVAPEGYSGDIKLLVGLEPDGTLIGVRVLTHSETPGLGDRIDIERSDWIHSFAGRSLQDPEQERWRVKKDGGVFDQFTGATITPRAVVKAVRNTLIYFAAHHTELWAPAAQPQSGDGHGP